MQAWCLTQLLSSTTHNDLVNTGEHMTDEKTLQPLGVVSDLNIELFGLRINDEKNAIFYDGIATRW